jgi:TPR repeat protein
VPRPSLQQAARLLRRAAQGGFVTAQFMLGAGAGKRPFGPRDLVPGARLVRTCGQAGSVPAQVAMGTAYYLGRGRGRTARAAHWYREAAKGGDEGAMYLLASMYEQGDGVPQDRRLARHWYGQAAAGRCGRQGQVAGCKKQPTDQAPAPTAPP